MKTDSAIMNELCQVLVARREVLGLSQVEVARRMGTSQSHVSALESGRVVSPGIALLERWARAVGLTMRWTMTARPAGGDDG